MYAIAPQTQKNTDKYRITRNSKYYYAPTYGWINTNSVVKRNGLINCINGESANEKDCVHFATKLRL